MKAAFYKNWKKLALVLTSVFWASCGDDSSSTAPITTSAESSSSTDPSSVGPTSSEEQPSSSSDTKSNQEANSSKNVESSSSSRVESPFSSSMMVLLYGVLPPSSSSEAAPESSSEAAPESSSATPTSSSGEKIACEEATLLRTGPSEPCIEDICPEYGVPLYEISGLKCEDGKEYELESICPDYGIPTGPCDTYFVSEDGSHLSEKEFKEIYRMAKPEGESSSSVLEKIVPIYGIEMSTEKKDID